MAPPSLSSAFHLLVTASLPKPSSLKPPKPLPALILALAASPVLPALADAPAPPPPPPVLQAESPAPTANPFANSLLTAPQPSASADLPDGALWRYSEFLHAVKKGKVERVRFSKDGDLLQLTDFHRDGKNQCFSQDRLFIPTNF